MTSGYSRITTPHLDPLQLANGLIHKGSPNITEMSPSLSPRQIAHACIVLHIVQSLMVARDGSRYGKMKSRRERKNTTLIVQHGDKVQPKNTALCIGA